MLTFEWRRCLVLFAVCACAGLPCGAAESDLGFGAAPEEPKPEITISAESVPAGSEFDVIADFTLDEKVHLYRDKLAFEWTKLEGASVRDIVFPEPEEVVDSLATTPGAKVRIYSGSVTVTARLVATGKPGDVVLVEGNLAHQSCTDQICFPPAKEGFAFQLIVTESLPGAQTKEMRTPPAEPQAGAEHASLLWRILGAFGWGVLLSLTPCVYPMIPVTAAIIGARKEKGVMSALTASVVYVLGLAIVYALLGVLVARLGSAASSFLQSPYVLVPVAVVFVALAVVMFAGLNLAAPTGVAARLQGMLAGKKGILPTFALGAVSGIVVGPCVTAPLAGILYYIADTGDSFAGFWMLFALAWGMGVPLVLFGTATGLMPKAGPWMEWIKKLLGFALLWGALYFVRHVIGELAYQVGFGLLLIAAAVFLGGFDALTRESSFGDRLKKVLGVIAVLVAVALLASSFIQKSVGTGPAGQTSAAENLFKPAGAADVEKAISAGKYVVLDFYADWCTICKQLDKDVFTRPRAVEAADGLAAFKIDLDKEPGLAAKYHVLRPPVIVFIGPEGQVRDDLTFVGTKTLDEFVELLGRFKPR